MFALPSAGILLQIYQFLLQLQFGLLSPIGCWYYFTFCAVLYGGDAEDRSGEAVHITMMLQVIEQEEVQQVQIVALLGRVVLPIDRRRR